MSTPRAVPRTNWVHSGTPLNAAPLLHLLGASKPDLIDSALVAVFRARDEGLTDGKKKQIASDCGGITPEETEAVRHKIGGEGGGGGRDWNRIY